MTWSLLHPSLASLDSKMSLFTGSTKGALDMLTKVMALELGPYKVSWVGAPPTTQPTCPGHSADLADPCLSLCRSE